MVVFFIVCDSVRFLCVAWEFSVVVLPPFYIIMYIAVLGCVICVSVGACFVVVFFPYRIIFFFLPY